MSVGEGQVLFNIFVEPRKFGSGIVTVLANLPDNFSAKTVTDKIFGLGMAPKEVLSRLFNLYNLKILDLHLETWLWSPLIWTEKTLHRGVDIRDYVKTYIFNSFTYFEHSPAFLTYIIILLFLLFYIPLLALLSLP